MSEDVSGFHPTEEEKVQSKIDALRMTGKQLSSLANIDLGLGLAQGLMGLGGFYFSMTPPRDVATVVLLVTTSAFLTGASWNLEDSFRNFREARRIQREIQSLRASLKRGLPE